MRSDIVPGGSFPDYELRDHSGTKRKLSELQGADPMVLILSRGAFCPKDREQHRLLVQMEPELKVAYTKIVTISTDAMMEANEMRDGLGAHWRFLIDPERTVQRDLGIIEYHNPMIPHTLVLEPGLIIYSVGPARCHREGTPRLGHHRSWSAGCVGAGRQERVLALRHFTARRLRRRRVRRLEIRLGKV